MLNFKSVLVTYLKGIIISIIFSLIAVLIFAGVVQIFSVPLNAIKPVAVAIKITSVIIGVFFTIKGEKGIINGGILGGLIIIFTCVLFSIIGSGFKLTLSFLWEILLGVGVGAISGIFSVNLKK